MKGMSYTSTENSQSSIGKIMCPLVTTLFTAIYFAFIYCVGSSTGKADLGLGFAIGSSYFFARHWYRTLVATDISTKNNEEDSLDRIWRATMTFDEYVERKKTRDRFLDRQRLKFRKDCEAEPVDHNYD